MARPWGRLFLQFYGSRIVTLGGSETITPEGAPKIARRGFPAAVAVTAIAKRTVEDAGPYKVTLCAPLSANMTATVKQTNRW